MKRAAKGRLTLGIDGQTFWQSPRFTAHPERRLRLSRSLPDLNDVRSISVGFDESR
jgi:hypothetical protein